MNKNKEVQWQRWYMSIEVHQLCNMGRYEEALKINNRLTKGNDPHIHRSLGNKAYILNLLGRRKEALTTINLAIFTLGGRDDFLWAYRAIILSDLERFQEASQCLDNVIQTSPKRAYGWALRATFEQKHGSVIQAIEYWKKCREVAKAHKHIDDEHYLDLAEERIEALRNDSS